MINKKELQPAPEMSKEERLVKSSYGKGYLRRQREWEAYKQKKADKLAKKQAKIDALLSQKELRAIARQERKAIRIDAILKLRVEKKYSMEQIGVELGVSRERIRQLVLFNATPEQQKIFRQNRKYRPITYKKLVCKECKKRKTVRMNRKSKFCSNECFRINLRKNAKWKSPIDIGRVNRVSWMYKNNPKFKKQHAKRMSAWFQELKKDPVKYKAHNKRQAIYQKRNNEKKKYGFAKTKLPEIF